MKKFDLDDLLFPNGEVIKQSKSEECYDNDFRETALSLGRHYPESEDYSYHGVSYRRWSKWVLCLKSHMPYFNNRLKMWGCTRCGSYGIDYQPSPAGANEGKYSF